MVPALGAHDFQPLNFSCHRLQIATNKLIIIVSWAGKFANVRMIAIQAKRHFTRCPELGRYGIDDVLSAVSDVSTSFGWDKTYHACNLGDDPEFYKLFLEIHVHLFRFYESEDFIVGQLGSEMIRGYLIEQRILLQRLEKRIFGGTCHGAGEIRSDVRQTSKVATTVRRGKKDQTFC